MLKIQSMYKNRVENDRNCFGIPTILSCKQGNSAENRAGKLKKYLYVRLDFPALDFLVRKIKEREFQKNSVIQLYPIFIYALPWLA